MTHTAETVAALYEKNILPHWNAAGYPYDALASDWDELVMPCLRQSRDAAWAWRVGLHMIAEYELGDAAEMRWQRIGRRHGLDG